MAIIQDTIDKAKNNNNNNKIQTSIFANGVLFST